MSNASAASNQQIFNEPLEASERDAVETLVARHRANAALTQQLALDASRLISTSQERLFKQSNAGFCRRFIGAFSGKNTENQLLNQADVLQMQKFAWHYLQQLQQQNLINAQSIAIIRNNLGTMNDYIIETREFLEQAIDKINSRLRHVENSTRLNNWSLNIEANKRRFKSLPSKLLVLQLTYSFMYSHRDVALTSSDVNHLVVTLEKLGINCDEKGIKLLDFIIELIDQIEVTGIDLYRDMIELSFDGHVVDSDFIQKNISGIAFNALYFLSEQHEKITGLIGDDELCNSDAAREKIISRFFGAEFSGLSATYDMRDLISEVIGGGLVAVDIYKEVNGLNVCPELLPEESHPEAISLVSSLPDIRIHTFLDSTNSDMARRDYVRLLALCLEDPASLGKQAQEFIALLAEKAGCTELGKEFPELAASPQVQQGYLPALQALLDDTDKMYSWLLDAFFLLTLDQRKIESPQMRLILSALKPVQFKENFANLLLVINEDDEAKILNAATSLTRHTVGWKNIIRYRALCFKQYFAETSGKLGAACWAATRLSMEMMKVSRNALDYAFYLEPFDDGFLSKVGSALGGSVYAMGRKSALTGLNEMRRKSVEFLSTHSSALYQANQLSARWNMPSIEFKNQIANSDYDLDNSAGNEDWHNQFEHHMRLIENTLESFSSACADAQAQLEFFTKGEFDQSIVEIKARKRSEWQRQQQQENLAKCSAHISRHGEEQLFSIEWKQFDHPPCDPESIRYIKTDGRVWLIATSDGAFHRSGDLVHWQEVHPIAPDSSAHVREIDVVDGVWILIAGYGEGFYYSSDARNWRQSRLPELANEHELSPTGNIVHFNGLWLWCFTRRQEYQYTDKGVLFDSKETSSYDETVMFSAESLDGQWQRWDGTPKLPEGGVVECIRSISGTASLLAFCKYDWFYTSKMKKTTSSFVSYYLPDKGWRKCTWGSDDDRFSNAVVTQMDDRLMCFYSNQFLTSTKGYEWNSHDGSIAVAECFHLDGLSLFRSRHDGQVIHLSQDAQTFKEIMLEKGSWNYFCANDQGALSIYSPNAHETSLRVGKFVFHPVA